MVKYTRHELVVLVAHRQPTDDAHVLKNVSLCHASTIAQTHETSLLYINYSLRNPVEKCEFSFNVQKLLPEAFVFQFGLLI